jgi:FkbM family methyltransferase
MYAEADDHIANEIFYNNSYEDDEFLLVYEIIQKSRFFIDVGANTGAFSIFSAKAKRDLSVISFEPHPANFKRFCNNISLNNVTNIIPKQVALGAALEMVAFNVPQDNSISTTSSVNVEYSRNFHSIAYREETVQQTTLDITLAPLNLNSFDIVKIDVEYYELEVVKGALKILDSNKPIVLIEILNYESLVEQFPGMAEKISKDHASKVFQTLVRCGYHAFVIHGAKLHATFSSTEHQAGRNFLFVPVQMPDAIYTFPAFCSAYAQAIDYLQPVRKHRNMD